MLRLLLWLFFSLQLAGGNEECFIHRACDSLQIGLRQALNRGLRVDLEVLRLSQSDISRGTQKIIEESNAN